MSRTTKISLVAINKDGQIYLAAVRGVITYEDKQRLTESIDGTVFVQESILAPSLKKLVNFAHALDPNAQVMQSIPLPPNQP